MEDTSRTPPIASRIWLWVLRGLAVIFALGSVLIAWFMFRQFLHNVPYWWAEWTMIGWFAMCSAALLCSGLPYALILWNLRRGPSRGKGLFQALIVGSFWFLIGNLLLIDSVFEQFARTPAEIREHAGEILENGVLSAGLCTLPGLLFLISTLKASRSLSASLSTSTEPSEPSGLLLDRVGVGGTMALLTFLAGLWLFAVAPDLNGLTSALIEALLVSGLIPYAFVFQRLQRLGPDREALTLGCGLALGCVTALILSGGLYSFAPRGKVLRPYGPYGWVALAFFALLALSNLILLRNGPRLRRPGVALLVEPLSWWSILVIPMSLLIFLWIFLSFIAGE